jgi:hypothetical protein
MTQIATYAPQLPFARAMRYFRSQGALARWSGYTPQAVSHWKKLGRVPPKVTFAILELERNPPAQRIDALPEGSKFKKDAP